MVLEARSDRDLLGRFLAERDEDAFAGLISRHASLVMGVSRRILGNAADAEDVFQATFIVLSKKASSIRNLDSISSWLHNVAVRIALRAKSLTEERRTRERRVAQMHSAAAPEVQEGSSDLGPALDQELSGLPEKYRAPLVLCYLDGMTNEGAARTLGLPSGSMSGRLEKGRELLRERLARRGVAVTTAVLGALLVDKLALAAAVSPAVVASAAKVAVLAAAGEAAVSAPVALLVKGGLQALVAAKAKLAAAAAITACLVGTAAGVVTYHSIRPEALDDPSYSAADVARVERRVAELAPTAAERRIDEIAWVRDLGTARRLSREHGRPIFFVLHDGDLGTGRFDGGAAGLRSGSLSDSRVISLLNGAFIPVHLSNEDLEPAGSATPQDRDEARRIYGEALDRKMPAGTGAVYAVAPNGRVLGSLIVPQAYETPRILALLEQARVASGTRQGDPVIKPTAQSRAPDHAPEDLVVHVVARYVDPSGAPEKTRPSWHEVPAENWLVLGAADRARILPNGEWGLGMTWTLPAPLARRILVHFYPATEDALRDDTDRSHVERTALRARVVSIRGDTCRARLEGEIRMARLFNKTHPEHDLLKIEGTVSGYLDFDRKGRVLALKLITDRATLGPSSFAVTAQSQ
jgi:RNA polymerase sigma factor (sigma-70 family)